MSEAVAVPGVNSDQWCVGQSGDRAQASNQPAGGHARVPSWLTSAPALAPK